MRREENMKMEQSCEKEWTRHFVSHCEESKRLCGFFSSLRFALVKVLVPRGKGSRHEAANRRFCVPLCSGSPDLR